MIQKILDAEKKELESKYTKLIFGQKIHWKNQLGSVMKFENVDGNTFEGMYYTSVGNVKKEDGHKLRGTFSVEHYEKKKKMMVSFLLTWSVQWTKLKDKSKPPSCTTWNAQVILDDKQESVIGINSMWLLRRFTDGKDCWDGVYIGKDFFKRIKID